MSGRDGSRLPLGEFARRAAVVAVVALLVAGLAAFAWAASNALLVLFATVLFAVLLDGLTRLLLRGIRMPRRLALTLVVLFIAAVIAGIFVFGGVRVANQAPRLRHTMQQSVQRIEHKLHGMGVSPNQLKSKLGPSSQGGGADLSALFSHVHGYLSTSFEMGADVLIIIVAGIYFAASPHFYIGTPLKLVPERRRERLRVVAREIGHALRRWLIGRFVSMLSVGIVTGIGMAALHVPLAALLAIIACLMTFIPYLGTIISLVPAVLVALLNGPMTALYVLLLFIGAHALEGYVISPLIQSRTVHLAPGWLIMSQLVGGLIAGIFGILIAAPLLVTLTIVVQLLYVEDTLGDSVHVLGE